MDVSRLIETNPHTVTTFDPLLSGSSGIEEHSSIISTWAKDIYFDNDDVVQLLCITGLCTIILFTLAIGLEITKP